MSAATPSQIAATRSRDDGGRFAIEARTENDVSSMVLATDLEVARSDLQASLARASRGWSSTRELQQLNSSAKDAASMLDLQALSTPAGADVLSLVAEANDKHFRGSLRPAAFEGTAAASVSSAGDDVVVHVAAHVPTGPDRLGIPAPAVPATDEQYAATETLIEAIESGGTQVRIALDTHPGERHSRTYATRGEGGWQAFLSGREEPLAAGARLADVAGASSHPEALAASDERARASMFAARAAAKSEWGQRQGRINDHTAATNDLPVDYDYTRVLPPYSS